MSTALADGNQATRQVTRAGGHVAEMQRRRLLLAIGEVVAQSGLEAATVGRLCEQAGVSRRTFYELFDDREACLLAAFDAAVKRIALHVRPAYENQGGWRERMRCALMVVLDCLDSDSDLARLCVIETPRAGAAVLERRRRVLESIAVAVDDGRTESRSDGEPPPLTAQGIVGGAVSVIHARLVETAVDGLPRPLVELAGPLMAMIVHPYLGLSAARAELERPVPAVLGDAPRNGADPFKGLPIRFTYRTAMVIESIASQPGASNRDIADNAGIADEGQTSRLLRRLQNCDLIENRGEGHTKGAPNAWKLTQRGEAIRNAIALNAVVG